MHYTIDITLKMCDNISPVRTAETLNTNSVDRIQVERLVFMNIEQLKIYLGALVCDYNLRASALTENTTPFAEKSFSKIMCKLHGAVTAARLLGVKVKITYDEPTDYNSKITLVSVQ